MKRILIILSAIVVLIGVGVGIYFLFFRGTAGLTVSVPEFPASGNGVPTTGEEAPIQDLGVARTGAGTELAPRFIRISDRPVATGIVAVYVPPVKQSIASSSASSTPVFSDPEVKIQYIERESGNVYTYGAHARTLTRLSNKTLPGILEASWLSDGSLAFVRFIQKSGTEERVNTYALPASGEGGYFLSQSLSQVATKGTTTLATLVSTSEGSSVSISTPTGGGLRTLFTSSLSSLRLAFLGSNYLATTKGSAKSEGYAFFVDGKTGAFTRALGPLQGLSTLPSPSGRLVLYSYLDRGKLALGVLDVTTHIATRLPLSTLPEKCVWSSDDTSLYCGVPLTLPGTLPDDWYQGATQFSDRLWKIDMSNRVATLVLDPKEAGGVTVDIVSLTIDRTSDVLGFINRTDHLLYVYNL